MTEASTTLQTVDAPQQQRMRKRLFGLQRVGISGDLRRLLKKRSVVDVRHELRSDRKYHQVGGYGAGLGVAVLLGGSQSPTTAPPLVVTPATSAVIDSAGMVAPTVGFMTTF